MTPSRLKPNSLKVILMLVLTFSTGIADAVGYLGLDKVFIGNMTGNVVILGMAIAGAARLPVAGPLIALGAFLCGAVATGGLTRRGTGWSAQVSAVLGCVGALTLGCATAAIIDPSAVTGHNHYLVTGVLAAGMGAQAAAARSIAVSDVTTVVVTSTITSLGADVWLAGPRRQPWIRRSAAVVLIGAGAAVGAVLLRLGAGVGLGIGVYGCLVVGVCVVGHHNVTCPAAELPTTLDA